MVPAIRNAPRETVMPTSIADKLAALGHSMPTASAPVANYVPSVRTGNLLSISGQISRIGDDRSVTGTLGAGLTVEEGRAAAEIAGLNVLAQIAAVVRDVAAVRRIVRLGVFVASAPGFADQPQVANGASDLMVAVFGDAGRHSRAAVGVAALPRGVAVEVDALVELED